MRSVSPQGPLSSLTSALSCGLPGFTTGPQVFVTWVVSVAYSLSSKINRKGCSGRSWQTPPKHEVLMTPLSIAKDGSIVPPPPPPPPPPPLPPLAPPNPAVPPNPVPALPPKL